MEQLVADVRAQIRARKLVWYMLSCKRALKARKQSMVIRPAAPPTLFLRVEFSTRVFEPRMTERTLISELEAQCEVLALLTILARLDLLAWRDQMMEIWTRLAEEVDAAVKTSAPFRLGLEVTFKDYTGTHIDGQPTFKGLKEWVISPRKASTSYQEVVSRAVRMTDNPQHIDIPARIILDFSVHQLRDILALTDSLAVLPLPNKSWLRLQEVGIDSTVESVASEEALAVAIQLIDAGVMARDLPAFSLTSAVTLLDTLQRLVPSTQAILVAYPGVATVVISDRAPWEDNLAVLSALVYSRSVHRVELRSSPPNERHPCYTDEQTKRAYWRWIAYAVLSHEAKNKVREIVANKWRVNEEELAMMREVLDAEDPLAVLMEETCDAAVDTAMVCASRFYFSAPWETPGREAADYTSGDALLVLTVKKVGDLGWSVLLPGYGKAWVRACDGVVTEATKQTVRPPLDVKCVMTNMTTATALCTAVGVRVRTLKLSKIDTSEEQDSDSWLRAILTQCPLLDELSVTVRLRAGHLAVLVDTPCAPRLRKLKIRGTVDCWYDSEDNRLPTAGRAAVFWQALATPHHPLARSLEDLSLHLQVCNDECVDFFDLIPAVLSQNRRLRNIDLDIPLLADNDQVEVEAEALEFKYGYFAQPVTCAVPLSRKTKLALLSVLSCSHHAAAQLDSSVLATVFEFAATTQPRSFSCHCMVPVRPMEYSDFLEYHARLPPI